MIFRHLNWYEKTLIQLIIKAMSMKTISLFTCFLCIFCLPKAYGQFALEVESGLAFQASNEIRIFNNQGTLFDFKKDFDLQGPVIPIRARASFTFNEKNHISALWAPLQIKYLGAAPRNIQFQDAQFANGKFVNGLYRFNSYRLTYRRDVVQTDKWTLGVGLTGKIRDASVQLEDEQAGRVERNDNVGFVPLLHLYAAYDFGGAAVYFEGDGLAAKQGRAFDLFLGTRIPLGERLAIKAGYRVLEGGTDSDEVYNFSWVNYAVAGLIFRL